jgi:Fe-S-cluster containining protein
MAPRRAPLNTFTMDSVNPSGTDSLPLAASSQPIECRRCGTCCTLHQAFVRPHEIARLAAFLGMTAEAWEDAYLDSRWQYNDYYLVRHVDGACAFLDWEDGLATCTVQPAKPDCCAAWQAGLDKTECRRGMTGVPEKEI